MTLSTIKDLNSLTSAGVLLVALEIFIPNTPVIRIVRNNENIEFMGQEYVAFAFEIGELSSGKGETPRFSLNIDNTSGAMQKYILAYDEYLKTDTDVSSIKTILYVLNSLDLSSFILSEHFELSDFSVDSKWVKFNLSTANLFNLNYPRRKMYKDFCPFKFKSSCCGYTGSDTDCLKNLDDCRKKGNSIRFGGFLGIHGGYKK